MTDNDDPPDDPDPDDLAEAITQLAQAVADLAAAIRGDRDPSIRSQIY